MDNIQLNAGSGGAVLATDDDGTAQHQYVKMEWGPDNTQTKVTTATPLPVQIGDGTDFALVSAGGALLVDASATTQPVSIAGTVTVDLGVNNDVTVTGSVTANAGTNLNTSALALESGGNLAGAATSLAVIDDWDELDRAKVNLIVGQAGIAAGAGAVGATVPRVTLASDDPAVTALQLIDNAVVAHDAPVSGATGSLMVGLNARSSEPTAVASADATYALGTLLGKLVNLPYAIPPSTWSYAAASGGITNTTGVTAKAAAGAGIRNYITRVQVINGHATVSTDVQIRDGASGTVLWRGFAQAAGGGVAADFDPPLRGSANTLVEVAAGTTGSAIYFNLQGFVAAE